MHDACPFCSPDGARIVFRNEQAYAMWDGYPVSPGHLLLIPHRHVASWFETTEAEQAALMGAIDRGRQVILDRYAPDGFNIGVNVGATAGQTVQHLHVHLIPRYDGDVPDPRGGVRGVIPGKRNYLSSPPAGANLLDDPSSQNLLVRGQSDPLLPHLRQCLDTAECADLAVAFVLRSGVGLIIEHLRDLLGRGGKVRIVTGDYLGVTDPDALAQLQDLGAGLELRVFEANSTSFHPKAYLFYDQDGAGTAFVGSSNLTNPALRDGVEWNYRVIEADAGEGFAQTAEAFERLYADPSTRSVDDAWLMDYRRRRQARDVKVVEVVEEPPPPPPVPHAIQQEALQALVDTREQGNEAGLVVLATGLGKTWLSAFDSNNEAYRRVLFVAHRQEILAQAMATFRRIRPEAKLGMYTGQDKDPDADVLFASIQTLGRMRHLRDFERDAFDYVIVDEFHHAAARTYRQLIDHFTPKFLLGLTATPERMDGGDLLALCQENLVYRRDMIAGISSGLLCPFQYFGVPDDVDYTNIPWRSARFDETELTNAVATKRRAANALQQLRRHGGKRTLGFCASQRHADFMAGYFTEQGLRAVAVHAGANSAPRASALESLAEGGLDVIFAVDMFNEGLDMPNIDTVLMLRPTESAVIWLQQFGRGLRRAEGKAGLKVVDYIGNHRLFLVKVRAMLGPVVGRLESDAEIAAAMRLVERGELQLPTGCHVTYDLRAMEIVRSLLRTGRDENAILSFYEDFKDRHGVRPTAVELYHSGYNPRSLRRSHGSWVGFVRGMGDLSDDESQVAESLNEFLASLETTRMTKSFKMLVLAAMLNQDAIPGQIGIDPLTQEFRRLAQRRQVLRHDVGEALNDEGQLRALIERNPIDAWCGARGTGGVSYFRYDKGVLATQISAPPNSRDALQALVREIVDWRLAEYLERDGVTADADRLVCKVLHSGGKPILKLPDRTKVPGVPSDWVVVEANGQTYVAKFAKQYVNVIRTEVDGKANVLSDIIRDWFGPDAGRPGTRHTVVFESHGDVWRMEPVSAGLGESEQQTWRHYMRADIPPLFGLQFNAGSWNQGFVVVDNQVILLVTLEKASLNKDHRYEDRFLSSDRFHWQSQNRTTQQSTHGQLIKNHQVKDVDVHLFVRRHKLHDGKAAPFVYCGLVDFEKWEGEKPISVEWRLREAVPQNLRSALKVPNK